MEYKKYKWFYTKSGKLVIGGKNAESNDALLSELKATDEDYVIMHTKSPGSPFSAIFTPIKNVNKSDIEECAIFTGCFSKAWKNGLQKTSVDIFHLSQLNKTKVMKSGTWSVTGKVQTHIVELELVLVMQEKVVRAIPKITPNKKEIIAFACPGKIDKSKAISDVMVKGLDKEQLLSALPAGGVSFKKNG